VDDRLVLAALQLTGAFVLETMQITVPEVTLGRCDVSLVYNPLLRFARLMLSTASFDVQLISSKGAHALAASDALRIDYASPYGDVWRLHTREVSFCAFARSGRLYMECVTSKVHFQVWSVSANLLIYSPNLRADLQWAGLEHSVQSEETVSRLRVLELWRTTTHDKTASDR
jgi:hypothetical protein